MNDEIEATFPNKNKDETRAMLGKAGAHLLKSEFMQKRVVFDIPGFEVELSERPEVVNDEIIFTHDGNIKKLKVDNEQKANELLNVIYSDKIRESDNKGWLRVRNEGDKITMTFKREENKGINGMREIELIIDSFDTGSDLFTSIGCYFKAYQETLRELWELDGVHITIDEWPYLEPFVEVEGDYETDVRQVSDKLGFEWDTAVFGAVDTLYAKKYGITKERINKKTPRIVFDEPNPFL